MKTMKLFLIGIFAVVALAVVALAGPPPPDPWPQYIYISRGQFVCSDGHGAPPCAGPSTGNIVGFWRFDDDGYFMNYREDAVIANSSITYNRELDDPYSITESFLFNNPNVTQLQCVSFPITTNFSRFWIQDADFVNETTVNGVQVFAYQGTWYSMGLPVPVIGWVSVDTGLFYGWNTGTVSYYYYEWSEVPAFDDSVFQKPPLTCMTPQEDIEHYKYKALVL
eukprot:TRINITY_DN3582_c1_g1_i1.p1 TRINITY_DN3582_c1_g1~~TRINITY_DN3582_c1_g1_i1.p1  ORF type:complete len:223 (+),score=52.10 TRINITY_DN3582_c1_g1_i1:209-877(+)